MEESYDEYSEYDDAIDASSESSTDFSVVAEGLKKKMEPPQKLSEFKQEYITNNNEIAALLRNKTSFPDHDNIPEMEMLRNDFKELNAGDRIHPEGIKQSEDLIKALEARMKKHQNLIEEFKKKPSGKSEALDTAADLINGFNQKTIDYAKQRLEYLRQESEFADLQKKLGEKCGKLNGKSFKGKPEDKWQQMMQSVADNKTTTLEFGKEDKTTITKTSDGKIEIGSFPPNPERDIEIAAANGLTSITIHSKAGPEYKQRIMEAANKHGILVKNPPNKLGKETLPGRLERLGRTVPRGQPTQVFTNWTLKNARYNAHARANAYLSKSENKTFRPIVSPKYREVTKCLDVMKNGGGTEEARIMLGLANPPSRNAYIDQAVKILKGFEECVQPNGDKGREIIIADTKRAKVEDFLKDTIFKDQPELFNEAVEKYKAEGGKLNITPVEKGEKGEKLTLG